MNLEKYLTVAVSTLNQDVLPDLPASKARDQLINCIRVLSRLATTLKCSPDAALEMFNDESLPTAIREAFMPLTSDWTANMIADDVTCDAVTSHGIEVSARWLMEYPWLHNSEYTKTAYSLLSWEERHRSVLLSRMAESEINVEREPNLNISGAKLTEETLVSFLQNRLGNPNLQVHEFKYLPGGRSRKTVMFRLSGQSDWPSWLIVQCDPPKGSNAFPGIASQFPVLQYVHRVSKLKTPKALLAEHDASVFGTPFMIVERLIGSPMTEGLNFFAAPPRSEKLALDLAEQLAFLHTVDIDPIKENIPNHLPPDGDWQKDFAALLDRVKGQCANSSIPVSAALAWMRENVIEVKGATTLVHGDCLGHNLLINGESLSGILDWEAVRIGHPGEDLGYIRPMIEQMISWDRFMDVYCAKGGPALTRLETDYFTLRAYILMLTHIANTRNQFESGRVNDILVAEVGSSLAPRFVNCISVILKTILHREQQGS